MFSRHEDNPPIHRGRLWIPRFNVSYSSIYDREHSNQANKRTRVTCCCNLLLAVASKQGAFDWAKTGVLRRTAAAACLFSASSADETPQSTSLAR